MAILNAGDLRPSELFLAAIHIHIHSATIVALGDRIHANNLLKAGANR
jgi:hypothetical protein